MNHNYCSKPAKTILCFALLVGLAFPVTSLAAPAFARIVGPSGAIVGDVELPGREGTVQIEDYNQNVSTPYLSSGEDPRPRSNPQHRPVRLVMQVNKVTPTLFGYWKDGLVIASVTVEFWKSIDAVETNYSTVVLNNAEIVGIIPYKSGSSDSMLETVSFIYESITISDGADNTVSVTATWDPQ